MTSIPSLTSGRGGGEEAATGREIQKISQPELWAPELELTTLYLTEDHKDHHLESAEEGEQSAVIPGRHVGVDHRGQAEAWHDDAQAGDELGDADWGWHGGGGGGGNTGAHQAGEAGGLRWWQGLLSSSSHSLTLNVLRNICWYLSSHTTPDCFQNLHLITRSKGFPLKNISLLISNVQLCLPIMMIWEY